MKRNPRLAAVTCCLLAVSLAVAQGNRTQLLETQTVALPPEVLVDERATPWVSSTAQAGFISSVTTGSLVSFSLKSGKLLSSFVVGESAGLISVVEVQGRRLIAVPAANDPDDGQPATVTIIDATDARSMDLAGFVVLPSDAHLTPSTRAVLTADGRFGVVASSFHEPTLFAFSLETGAVVSRLPLLSRPSEIALYDPGERARESARCDRA